MAWSIGDPRGIQCCGPMISDKNAYHLGASETIVNLTDSGIAPPNNAPHWIKKPPGSSMFATLVTVSDWNRVSSSLGRYHFKEAQFVLEGSIVAANWGRFIHVGRGFRSGLFLTYWWVNWERGSADDKWVPILTSSTNAAIKGDVEWTGGTDYDLNEVHRIQVRVHQDARDGVIDEIVIKITHDSGTDTYTLADGVDYTADAATTSGYPWIGWGAASTDGDDVDTYFCNAFVGDSDTAADEPDDMFIAFLDGDGEVGGNTFGDNAAPTSSDGDYPDTNPDPGSTPRERTLDEALYVVADDTANETQDDTLIDFDDPGAITDSDIRGVHVLVRHRSEENAKDAVCRIKFGIQDADGSPNTHVLQDKSVLGTAFVRAHWSAPHPPDLAGGSGLWTKAEIAALRRSMTSTTANTEQGYVSTFFFEVACEADPNDPLPDLPGGDLFPERHYPRGAGRGVVRGAI